MINDDISHELKSIFENIQDNYYISIQEWNHDVDHVHILFKANPKTGLAKFLNSYKSASSRIIKKKIPEIKSKLWKESFWTKSYFLTTTGGTGIEVVRKYIENQGE